MCVFPLVTSNSRCHRGGDRIRYSTQKYYQCTRSRRTFVFSYSTKKHGLGFVRGPKNSKLTMACTLSQDRNLVQPEPTVMFITTVGSYVFTGFDIPPAKNNLSIYSCCCVDSSGHVTHSPDDPGRISVARKGLDRAFYR